MPDAVAQLVREAHRRIEEFGLAVPGFVHSDFERVYGTLAALRSSGLAAGDTFCEWGSGFGVVALIAARLGFHAYGIEIHPDLVREARQLADDFGIDAEFVCGTFVPDGGEDLTDHVREFDWLEASGPCGYSQLELEPADFDVVSAYPWPGEEHVIEGLFERFASDGALLVTYHGYEEIRVRRKVQDGSRFAVGGMEP